MGCQKMTWHDIDAPLVLLKTVDVDGWILSLPCGRIVASCASPKLRSLVCLGLYF